jgi:hypothetical protein
MLNSVSILLHGVRHRGMTQIAGAAEKAGGDNARRHYVTVAASAHLYFKASLRADV